MAQEKLYFQISRVVVGQLPRAKLEAVKYERLSKPRNLGKEKRQEKLKSK